MLAKAPSLPTSPPQAGERSTKNPSPTGGAGERARAKRVSQGRAKGLRNNQTNAERRLWYHLRAHRFFGLKFKRQKPIGSFIVDFICMEQSLVVEVDGGQHSERSSYDAKRDRWLQSQGWTILRFWNDEVLKETESVLESIRIAALSPTPLPQAGEGTR